LSEGSPALRFALASLATWRIAHLVVEEDGPFELVVQVRERAGDGVIGSLLDCFYCSSVWVGAACAPAVTRRRKELPLAALALSGAACLLERVTKGGDDDELLWQEAEAGKGSTADAREPRRDPDASRSGVGDDPEAGDAAGDEAVTLAR
jgi:hypothetical protein